MTAPPDFAPMNAESLKILFPSTTEIYAKIDMRSLHEVVRPWPTRGGAQ